MKIAFVLVYLAVAAVLGYGFKHEHDRVSRHPGYDDVKAFQAARKAYLALPRSEWEGKI